MNLFESYKQCCTICVLLLASCCVHAQEQGSIKGEETVVVTGHALNDYEHDQPLLVALAQEP